MYWYDSGQQGYLLTLGAWTHEPPPAPSWRAWLVREGIPQLTKDEIENVWLEHEIWPEDYDSLCVNDTGGTASRSRMARAPRRITCLKKSTLDQSVPHLKFNIGAHPGDSSYRAGAKAELSLSLLQARLIDSKIPIRIAQGT